LTLTAEEIETLERWVRCPTTAQALAQRARIVLACTSGDDDTVVAAHAPVTRQAIGPVAPAINDARTGGGAAMVVRLAGVEPATLGLFACSERRHPETCPRVL